MTGWAVSSLSISGLAATALSSSLSLPRARSLQIPVSFTEFHNGELVDEPDAALAKAFFTAWAAANPTLVPLATGICVGHEIPLFLGGRDEVENLAPVDLWAYWAISGQLLRQTLGRDQGTTISSVTIA